MKTGRMAGRLKGFGDDQDGVTSIRAEIVQRIQGISVDFDAHDFY